MIESFQGFDMLVYAIIALVIGVALGALLSRPQKGEKGDTGEPGMTGPMGIMGEPGRLEPHTHRIKDIEGLAEHLGIHDQDEPRYPYSEED